MHISNKDHEVSEAKWKILGLKTHISGCLHQLKCLEKLPCENYCILYCIGTWGDMLHPHYRIYIHIRVNT